MKNTICSQQPIGIFDSGVGGLPIAQKIYELMPNETLIYVADSAHAPYGEKSEDDILQRSIAVVEFLLSQNVKAIVVACNTATMVAIKILRDRYDIPFIGVEPGVKPGAIHTKTGVVGVLATEKTLSSHAFDTLAKRVAGHVEIAIQPSPQLVRLVESLQLEGAEVERAVEGYVAPLMQKGADTIILGCTHFTHLDKIIQKVAGDSVQVISTEQAVAKEVQRRLMTENLQSTSEQKGQVTLFSNSEIERFVQQVKVLWQGEAEVLSFEK